MFSSNGRRTAAKRLIALGAVTALVAGAFVASGLQAASAAPAQHKFKVVGGPAPVFKDANTKVKVRELQAGVRPFSCQKKGADVTFKNGKNYWWLQTSSGGAVGYVSMTRIGVGGNYEPAKGVPPCKGSAPVVKADVRRTAGERKTAVQARNDAAAVKVPQFPANNPKPTVVAPGAACRPDQKGDHKIIKNPRPLDTRAEGEGENIEVICTKHETWISTGY